MARLNKQLTALQLSRLADLDTALATAKGKPGQNVGIQVVGNVIEDTVDQSITQADLDAAVAAWSPTALVNRMQAVRDNLVQARTAINNLDPTTITNAATMQAYAATSKTALMQLATAVRDLAVLFYNDNVQV